MTEPRALFSSARDALTFALNFEDDRIPGPVMNRVMVQVDKARAEAQARSYAGSTRRAGNAAPRHVPLGTDAQDRATTAGWILQSFNHLDPVQRLVLTLTVMRPRVVCVCGAPCCRGWTVKTKWVEAVRLLCEYLKHQAELTKEPGKRGLSTDPRLRQALVEDYAKPAPKRGSLTRLAEITDVTSVTVAKHRTLIHEHLEELERGAWLDLQAIFDAKGITGDVQVDGF